jgi:HD-like signal output (HDOD) protein
VPLIQRFSDALRNLFGSAGPGAPTAASRAAVLERKIRALVDDLPAMPATAARAMALIEDPDVPLAEVAKLLEEDAALAAALLRVANSALFAGGAPALRLNQAVVRLGLWTCKTLINGVVMRSALRPHSPDAEVACQALWRHGTITATLCTRLNREYRLGFGGEEYAAGLLHDLGRTLVALADPECLALANMMDFREEGDVLARERAAIGVDHSLLGAWFAELSGLPETLVEVVRRHHPTGYSADRSRLVQLVSAADHAANYAHYGAGTYDPTTNPDLVWLTASWAAGRRAHLYAALPALLRDAVEAADRLLE